MDNVGEMIVTALINRLLDQGIIGEDDVMAIIEDLESREEQEAVDSVRALLLEREAGDSEMHDLRREGLHLVTD